MNPRIPALAVEYEDCPSLPSAETLAVNTRAAPPVRVPRGAPGVKRGLGELHRSRQVEGQGEVPVIAIDARESGVTGHPRVGDEGIELAVGLYRPVHHLTVEAFGGDVPAPADSRSPSRSASRAPRRPHQPPPGRCRSRPRLAPSRREPLDRGPPDPVAGSGHDDGVALEAAGDGLDLLDLFERPSVHQGSSSEEGVSTGS